MHSSATPHRRLAMTMGGRQMRTCRGISHSRNAAFAAAALAALVAGCGTSNARTSSTGDSPASTTVTTSASVQSPPPTTGAPTTVAQTGLNYSLPLESPRKYQGTLHISSPPPQVVLGDPGSIQVAPLTTTTAR
jgi:hypothetical protein